MINRHNPRTNPTNYASTYIDKNPSGKEPLRPPRPPRRLIPHPAIPAASSCRVTAPHHCSIPTPSPSQGSRIMDKWQYNAVEACVELELELAGLVLQLLRRLAAGLV